MCHAISLHHPCSSLCICPYSDRIIPVSEPIDQFRNVVIFM
ncbi:hypothetical protein HMPREF9412_3286 [Paenibacillus sp. HGF5]|nr:hypothetical protein HMPREF9412_3286 [Paenibacillus sp. HGF5]